MNNDTAFVQLTLQPPVILEGAVCAPEGPMYCSSTVVHWEHERTTGVAGSEGAVKNPKNLALSMPRQGILTTL